MKRKISDWVAEPPMTRSGDKAATAKKQEWLAIIEEIRANTTNGEWAVIEYESPNQASGEKGWLTKQASLGVMPALKATVRGNRLYVSIGE